ncbi:hypothetical protein [Burkholderia sp. Bp8998]|uniref:hypothetical protein n=1 Tax=Burkholderia sp. Bp8998 TaxID=2184557 RepID=UPI000F59CA6E|nr:hypothetical protein [Burkholderia sp. Bp8998]RQS12144.1 hypothetical protein DIE06_27375 [Burkholderia sp. Bp8998]
MFGLYPAGARWVQQFSASNDAKALQKGLVDHGGCTAALFHQPFGSGRGVTIAQRDSFLVLVHATDVDSPEVAVVPDVQMQNLLWSFSSGYASQWSGRELQILTGCTDWDALIKQASASFAQLCDTVRQAVAGTLGTKVIRPEPMLPIDDEDILFLPSEYLQEISLLEAESCVR